ncbi:MAG: DUF805 domain-containing protein [bacterium]|nr:DUF805 domain-containing protein [bacterium]
MSVSDVLFSFEGRIPRRVFWAATLACHAIAPILIVLSWMLAGTILMEAPVVGILLGVALTLIVSCANVWVSLAVAVKRWHDLDKSGVWVLIVLIPIAGGIWALVETGCLRGTYGRNQYGADPT